MKNLFSKLWSDDAGVVTLEYLILASILALGLIVGVSGLTGVLNSELTELAQAISSINQSFSSTGYSNCVSSKAGSSATDAAGTNLGLTKVAPVAPGTIATDVCP